MNTLENMQQNKTVDGCQLLATARDALLQRLLPALPTTLHYEARMIANAMLIASRDLALGYNAEQMELTTLRTLLDTESATPASSTPSRDSVSDIIAGHQRLLCLAIRRGEFDANGARQDALLAAMTQITRNKLAISNPRALAQG